MPHAVAKVGDTVIAESDNTEVVEGNQYFPPADVKKEFLKPNDKHTVCHWKGEASYYDVKVDGETLDGAAWYYPEPSEAASAIKNYIAFWRGVEVETS